MSKVTKKEVSLVPFIWILLAAFLTATASLAGALLLVM
jgi:hypothetical protein